MKIKQIVSQSRRDFTAIYECEHCGYEEEGHGYDDSYFHNRVIPKKICPNCGQISPEEYSPLTTKYPDSMTI